MIIITSIEHYVGLLYVHLYPCVFHFTDISISAAPHHLDSVVNPTQLH